MKKMILLLTVAALMTGSAWAAPTLDLSTATSGTINGAIFQHTSINSTGTGVIQSFVRIQKNGIEQGYNTDGAIYYDEKGGLFTRSIVIADIPVMNIDGTNYREFLLDINQINNKSLLSLDAIQIYLATSGSLTGPASGLGTKIYDLDAGGDHYILLDYSLEPGSGGGDMRAYIPSSLFVGTPSTTYVYLYSKFGDNNEANDGFEEWAVRKETTPPVIVPAPGALLLGTLGMGLVGWIRRTRTA